MDKEHVISDDALYEAGLAIQKNENWLAYNSSSYFLEKKDMYFFKDREDAEEFASGNISEYDLFNVINVYSVADLFRQITYGTDLRQQLIISSQQNATIMNEKNLDYLKDNIKYLGFGDKMNGSLEKNMNEGKPEFTLNASFAVKDDTLGAALHFRKSEASDMYFLNSYDARLSRPEKEDVSQSFRLDNGKGVTAKEAYNLLEGRSVLKEMTNQQGEKYQAWIKLDFENKDEKGNFKVQRFTDNYGYNLKGAVVNLPLAALSEEKENQLMKSLQKGNIHEVAMLDGKEEKKMFIAANPQYKTMDIYDSDMKSLSREQKEKLQYEPDAAVHQMKTKSENAGTVKEPGAALSNGKENNLGEDKGAKKLSAIKNEEQAQGKDGAKKKSVNEKGPDKKENKFKGHAKTDNVESLLPKKRTQQHGKGMSM